MIDWTFGTCQRDDKGEWKVGPEKDIILAEAWVKTLEQCERLANLLDEGARVRPDIDHFGRTWKQFVKAAHAELDKCRAKEEGFKLGEFVMPHQQPEYVLHENVQAIEKTFNNILSRLKKIEAGMDQQVDANAKVRQDLQRLECSD